MVLWTGLLYEVKIMDFDVISLEDLEEAESCAEQDDFVCQSKQEYLVEDGIVKKIFHDYSILELPEEIKGMDAEAVEGFCIQELRCWFVPSKQLLYELSSSVFNRLSSGADSKVVYRLSSLILRNPSTELVDYSIMECLESLSVVEENPYYKTIDGVLFSKNGTVLLKYPSLREAEQYRVPDGVQRICSLAFSLCHYLRELWIADSVSTLEPDCVYRCESLQLLHLSDSMKHFPINPDASKFPFSGIDNVRFLKLPSGMKFLQDECLTRLTVEELVLNEGLNFIGRNVFPNTLKGCLILPQSLLYAYPNRLYGVESIVAPYRIPGFSDSLFYNALDTSRLHRTILIEDQESEVEQVDPNTKKVRVKKNANNFLIFTWAFYKDYLRQDSIVKEISQCLRQFWESDPLDYAAYDRYVELSLSKVPLSEKAPFLFCVLWKECYAPEYMLNLCNSMDFIKYCVEAQGEDFKVFRKFLNAGWFSERILRKFLRSLEDFDCASASLVAPLVLDALAGSSCDSLDL